MIDRRTFLTAASGLALTARMARASVQGANNRIRIAIIGTGGRARGLMNLLKRLPGNDMVAVCDVYEPRMLQAVEIAGATTAKVADYRRILDNREIDAVLIGTPDHWHKKITLEAVAAGKDVYVEKPMSHTLEEGVEMVKAVEASKQIVQTGTQQRSWDHWVLGKQIIDSGRLGQITFVQTYWYQHATAGNYPAVSMDKLDLMTHWIDVVHWYMDVDAPLTTAATGRNYNLKTWEAPDTVNATIEFPKNFMAVYLGTYVSKVDDGGLEFRGDRGTLKIDRARLAFYRDDAAYAAGTLTPEPDIYVRSSGDGTLIHLQNWLDCIRSRKTPNANVRVAHQAARTSHLTNIALRSGKTVRWNNAAGRIDS
jgi:predicted dehydrogenase